VNTPAPHVESGPFELAARVLPLCFVVACQGESTAPTTMSAPGREVTAAATDNVVASLAVIPDSQMVFAGDQFRVTARPRNRAGQVLDVAVVWKVSNTSVVSTVGPFQATMTFKALRVGTTSVKATVGDKSRFSKVVVRAVSGAKVVVTPAEATVAPGATVQFVATGLTTAGETASVSVTWSGTAGAISPTGVLTAGNTPGTYRVIAISAFGAADTSLVTIGDAPGSGTDPVTDVILVPEHATVTAGDIVQFAAYGRTDGGDSVAVTLAYTATGGTIAADGRYTAGGAAGTYRVVAASPAGIADTSEVVISAAPIAQVVLLPDIAASRPGETSRFAATVLNTVGQSVPEPVTYQATCGAVTSVGVFTAPQGGSGGCLLTASAGEKADTTEVVLLTNTLGQGIPFGLHSLWASATTTPSSGVAAFSASQGYFPPGELAGHIAAARARGIRLVLVMTGGAHTRYKTDGVFDQAKWEAAMDAFDTPAIRDAVAAGVADGTIIGNTVMDEPQQSGTDVKAWGPAGTMTKARVDGLCGYVKAIFPTLPVGVGHDHNVFEPANSYQVCEFLIVQYAARKGNVVNWRDGALSLAARDRLAIIFSLNLLDGGTQDRTGVWDCAGTGGLGTHGINCRMTPAQVRDWGKLLGQAGCALLSWRYDGTFMGKPENQAAISDVAITLSRLPQVSCKVR
jgi:plastocyanin